MARKKRPENETAEQLVIRKTLETISNSANRSEKTSWNRKLDNMVKILARLRPIEQKILDIIENEKMPIQDEIQQLRKVMVRECVHPYEYLVLEGDHVCCKFCDRKLSIQDAPSQT